MYPVPQVTVGSLDLEYLIGDQTGAPFNTLTRHLIERMAVEERL